MKRIKQGDNVSGMRECMRKPLVEEALQLEEPTQLETMEGLMRGSIGDFLMRDINGEYYILNKYLFENNYDWVSYPDNIEEDDWWNYVAD